MPETTPVPTKPGEEKEGAPAPVRPAPDTRPSPFDPSWPEDRPLPQPKGLTRGVAFVIWTRDAVFGSLSLTSALAGTDQWLIRTH